MNSKPGPVSPRSNRAWPWLLLVSALAWVIVARVPLVLNSGAHLDSDLAVDGLTLIDAMNGHWRWHYPATPFIGTPPVLLSLVQAELFGANPITLASGGLVAYLLVVGSTFALNLRAFGGSVAAWGLVPLAFASTGTIWLSGRVTGGHLLAVAWHASAFALFQGVVAKGGWRRSLGFGVWSGFGLYVDAMFALTWVGLGVGTLAWIGSDRGERRFGRFAACVLAFALGAGLGFLPRVIGQRVDPHDAYLGQFRPDLQGDSIARNLSILVRDCLPRLVVGHRLSGLQAEPEPSKVRGSPLEVRDRERGGSGLALAVVVVGLLGFVASMATLAVGPVKGDDPIAGRAVRWGLIGSSTALVAGFLVNPTISNSDNYRYLVFLLVPWSTGAGLMGSWVASKGWGGAILAGALALGFAGLMTLDSARWYAGFGWVDEHWRPTRRSVEDPTLAWLDAHPEVSAISGDYWDVYRLSFLTGGRVRGVPFPQYPNRFPEIARSLPGGRPRFLISGPVGLGQTYRAEALGRGGREVMRGSRVSIVDWPVGTSP
jgi:hypothetical protein